jgi:hypothetical protein
MKINSLRNNTTLKIMFEDTMRETFITKFENASLTGRNIYYPNCLIQYEGKLINPYDERVMSLKKDTFYDNNEWGEYQKLEPTQIEETPCYFFIYNVDNYYHFLYDTLSLLYGFFEIKKYTPNLKLLLNTSHPTKTLFAPFIKEFLEKLGAGDYLIANNETCYKELYVPTSITHGQKSNSPPSLLAYSVWNRLETDIVDTPKRFYISRRSWIHGKKDNIGTNYTERRKCLNEDRLVDLLKKYNIQEVFTELLTTEEKIAYFKNAEIIVGVVGGGMCNILFSPSKTKALCINTPYFLEINERFKHSMNHTNIIYSDSTYHEKIDYKFRLYSRVKIINPTSQYYNCIGEIEMYENILYTISLSSNDIAGFSQNFQLKKEKFNEDELEAVDFGLNSPYICDLNKLEQDLKKMLLK